MNQPQNQPLNQQPNPQPTSPQAASPQPRWEPIMHTLKIRTDAVTRLLMGEDPQALSAELNIPAKTLEQWAKEFCRADEMRLRLLPDNWVERWLAVAEKLVPIATLISVLLAVTLFVQGERKEAAQNARAATLEREARVRDAYSSLDDRYLDYVKLCLEHPDLDVFDTPMVNRPRPTFEQQRQEAMVLSMLISIMERAYLMYCTHSDNFEKNQWSTWAAYMKMWSARPNFRAEWLDSKNQFDAGFAGYLDGLIQMPATNPS